MYLSFRLNKICVYKIALLFNGSEKQPRNRKKNPFIYIYLDICVFNYAKIVRFKRIGALVNLYLA